MSIVKLYEDIGTSKSRNMEELANSDSFESMSGFDPIQTVIRDIAGAPDKLFRVGKMI